MCAKAKWKRCFHTLNWTMRRLDTIFCDFICTNNTYQYIYNFRFFFFLVSYTSSSLFSCVAVSASGKQKQQWLFLVRRLDRFGYAFPYLAILCKLTNTLLFFLFSIFDWYSFSFFYGSYNFFSSPFYIFPEFLRFSENF